MQYATNLAPSHLAFARLEETLRRPRPHAPPRASARPSAPFRASSIAAPLFVSFRVSRRRAFVSGARGGDKSRDALRRTGRDAVSSPRATPRIKVAQQPASTRPAFVVARSAPPSSPPAAPLRWRGEVTQTKPLLLPVRAEIARLINEYLNARHGRTNKYGGDFPAVRWTFTPAR